MILEQVKMFIEMYPELTGVYLIVAKIVSTILFFPGTPLTLLAGASLGVFWGSIVSIIGNTLGALAAFCIARFFLRDYVQKYVYTKYPAIKGYESRFLEHGLVTVLLLRLIPLFPFNALNYLLGVTKVSTKDYVVGTAVGIIPGTIVFVYFGQALVMLSVMHIVISVVAIIVLLYMGKIYKKRVQ